MRRTRTVALLPLAAALALTGCSEDEAATVNGMEREAYYACEDFALRYDELAPQQDRVDLAEAVHEWAPHSDLEPIRDTAATLVRVAEGAGDTVDWQMAADSFATACIDNGWNDAN
ncbi:hypothetical protein RM844_28760 [Streptomyces sp. DSM 44915]|uniref:Lipoprotein n=1 Tax=Streptomyces chisholmiae TaxID=3075540 RepID=A0ABU2JZ75_9ACTN|nr:hypothetical protein [Streptomyces sp. DSM 44915]MDT0270269.1 hypothetical protein [Streptomyces sp. DSM 44915]